MEKIPDYIEEYCGDGKKYTLLESIIYYSKRYDKVVIVYVGYRSDGATGALDIKSEAWWVHDKLCADGEWYDGTPITNWEASQVLSDVLKSEGRWLRSKYWFWATFLFGGKNLRG